MLTLDDIGRQSITAFGQAVPSSNLAFYRINKALQPHDFILQGIAHPMHEAYLRHYRHIDPLKPSSCVQSRQPVLSLRQAFDYQPSAHNVRYQHFLARYDIADVVEILIHHQGYPVAGLSLLRQHAAFDQRDLNTLHALHQLTELAVAALEDTGLPLEATCPAPVLTPREQDVVGLVCQGLSNKHIARLLDIGEATVKTHLMNAFEKYGVHSRVELTARCLGKASNPLSSRR